MPKGKPSAKAAGAMSDMRFWLLIDAARDSRNFYTSLTTKLEALSAKEIIGFENTLQCKLRDGYTFPVLAANFVIQSYTSDDVFEDFRAWLVSQGQERFESALSDPESICDWLDRDEVDEIDGESMLLVAQKAYEEHGDEDDFADQVKRARPPVLNQDWPKDKAGFRKRWPRLVDKFWNQERIREIHSG